MAGNAEIIRNLYGAFDRDDLPAVLGVLDRDVVWIEAEGFPYAGSYTGTDAVVQGVLARLGTEWEDFNAVPHQFVAEGDTVVALGEYSGRYKATGKKFSAPFAHVWTLRGGKVVRFRQYTDTLVVDRALR